MTFVPQMPAEASRVQHGAALKDQALVASHLAAHPNHSLLVLRPAYYAGEDGARRVVTGEPSLRRT